MIRKVAMFMGVVLFFNISLSCFPQLIDIEQQAKADAKTNTNKEGWFFLSASTCALGVFAGYQIGSLIDPDWSSGLLGSSPNDAQSNGMCIGPTVGYLSLLISISVIPTHPPTEKLLGKSPEYIQAYTKAYKDETQLTRTKSMFAGIIPGTFFGCLIVYSIFASGN